MEAARETTQGKPNPSAHSLWSFLVWMKSSSCKAPRQVLPLKKSIRKHCGKALCLTACSLGPVRSQVAGSHQHCQSWSCSPCHNLFLHTAPLNGDHSNPGYEEVTLFLCAYGWEMCLRSSERKRQKNTHRVASEKLILQWVYEDLQQNLSFLNYAVREWYW